MPERPGDGLPRPATPGPWTAAEDDDYEPVVLDDRGDPLAWIAANEMQPGGLEAGRADARAIAALPAWIAAHDAERARAERAAREATEWLEKYERASQEAQALRARTDESAPILGLIRRAERAEAALAEVRWNAEAGTSNDGAVTGAGIRFQANLTLRVLARHGYGEASE